MEVLQRPASLVCVMLCLLFITVSILLFLSLTFSQLLHVPAHAFVQSSVGLAQVRRRLTVAEDGQPELTELPLTDAEVRHAGNADRRERYF